MTRLARVRPAPTGPATAKSTSGACRPAMRAAVAPLLLLLVAGPLAGCLLPSGGFGEQCMATSRLDLQFDAHLDRHALEGAFVENGWETNFTPAPDGPRLDAQRAWNDSVRLQARVHWVSGGPTAETATNRTNVAFEAHGTGARHDVAALNVSRLAEPLVTRVREMGGAPTFDHGGPSRAECIHGD